VEGDPFLRRGLPGRTALVASDGGATHPTALTGTAVHPELLARLPPAGGGTVVVTEVPTQQADRIVQHRRQIGHLADRLPGVQPMQEEQFALIDIADTGYQPL